MKTPLTLTAMMRSQSSSVVSSIPLRIKIPALFTRISSLPYVRTTVSTAARQSASLVTLRCTYIASPPAARISASTLWPSSSKTSPKTTVAPSRQNSLASVSPWPLAPPLISATFPSSLPMGPSSQKAGERRREASCMPCAISEAPRPVVPVCRGSYCHPHRVKNFMLPG